MDSALYLVKHQNTELMFALKCKKRSISDLRGQLQHQKQQTAVAEDLLSVLDRSYNQVCVCVCVYVNVCVCVCSDRHNTGHCHHGITYFVKRKHYCRVLICFFVLYCHCSLMMIYPE